MDKTQLKRKIRTRTTKPFTIKLMKEEDNDGWYQLYKMEIIIDGEYYGCLFTDKFQLILFLRDVSKIATSGARLLQPNMCITYHLSSVQV